MKLKVIGTDGAYTPVNSRAADLSDGLHLDGTEIEVIQMLSQGIKFQDACEFAHLFDSSEQESLYTKVQRLGLN